MKPRSSLFALSFSAGLLALSVTGCSTFQNRSTGPDATKPVGGKAVSILQLRDDVRATRAALNRAADALNRISDSPDAQAAYAAFSTELNTFRTLAETTLRSSGDVRNGGKTLFAEWEREVSTIKNPEIRAIAEQRRVSLHAGYDAMITPLLAARADLTEVRNDLVDIQKALALDLTPNGILAVQKPVAQIRRKVADTAASLDALSAKLDSIATMLPASTVAPLK